MQKHKKYTSEDHFPWMPFFSLIIIGLVMYLLFGVHV